MDNIFSAYHYACKTKADREAIEEIAPKVLEAADKAAFGNIGDIRYTARTTAPMGGEWCDGATYTKDRYPVLYDMLVSGKLQYVDIATYNSVVELNGSCGMFGLDVANNSFRVPTLTDVYIKAGQVAEEFSAESLPNITGISNGYCTSGTEHGTDTSGCIYNIVYDTGQGAASNGSWQSKFGIDASRSSSTYQDGAKVNPDHVTCRAYVILYTGKDISFDKKEEYKLNNPFSLLDYKWSEYAIANSSWLISNGSFHSGAVYKSAYELLMKIYNGAETKDGVSVKLSTEEYSDTDFVIDTANTTFRLPIKVKLASGNAVIGNGMTLGLTDGTDYAGFGMHNLQTTDGYGKDVGTSANAYTISTFKNMGITTDPTKSGIETSSQGLKLYFYVGETVQDPSVIDASGVLTRVANCIDRTSATDRETVVGWGIPNYNAGYTVSSGFTANTSGVLKVYVSSSYPTIDIRVNNVQVVYFRFEHHYGDQVTYLVRVDKGDVVTFNGSGTFYPDKGV